MELAKVGKGFHDPTIDNPSIYWTKVRKNLRDRSCLLLCSLRLKARAQYVHLYLRSIVFCAAVFGVVDDAAVAVAAAGIVKRLMASQSLIRVLVLERKRLTDAAARMAMGWMYAKLNPFDHASDCGKRRMGGRGDFGLGWLVRVIWQI